MGSKVSYFRTALVLVFSSFVAFQAAADPLQARRESIIDASFSHYELIYQDIHRNPELSNQEVQTARKVALELNRLGIDVTTGVGGTGVVGVLRNGAGPIVAIRADMDALPIQELTGLPYASQNAGVMHACGHDAHTTAMLATANVLVQTRDAWQGTVVFIAQPAEEVVSGARAMIADGLFERFPKPDLILGLHISGQDPAGSLSYRPGFALAASDSVDVELHGADGHGARPHMAVDPIVLGSEFVLKMNALINREVDPLTPALITVGSFHGGTKHNIVPASVKLQLTVRNYSEETRAFLHRRIREVAEGLSTANRSPAPVIAIPEHVSATYNDPELARIMLPVFNQAVGAENVSIERPMTMGGEDFSEYVRLGKLPGLFFFVGATDPALPKPWPGNHTAKIAPDFARVYTTGVRAMSAAAMHALGTGAGNLNRLFPGAGRSGNYTVPETAPPLSPLELENIRPLY